MEYILMAAMVFGAILVVGYPLVNPRRYAWDAREAGAGEAQDQLLLARDKAFDALRDCEFDHATGKLSDADYQALRTRYEMKAATVLQQLDALEASLAHKEKPRAGHKPAGRITCPRCHARFEPGDKFCAVCGEKL